jgi:hypothetical protein
MKILDLPAGKQEILHVLILLSSRESYMPPIGAHFPSVQLCAPKESTPNIKAFQYQAKGSSPKTKPR